MQANVQTIVKEWRKKSLPKTVLLAEDFSNAAFEEPNKGAISVRIVAPFQCALMSQVEE
jgi:hypothetical protein